MSNQITAKKRRVVVIDDSPDHLALVTAALASDRMAVFTATSGREGMALIESHKPDLVILDYHMPEMSGIDTLKRLRENQNYVAVIFVSANAEHGAVNSCLEAGADDYILKPFHFSELVTRVNVRLRIKDLHDELQEVNLKLKELSERDDVTGLFNMRYMYDRIEFELKRARRFGRNIVCVMMDMDNFKTINDGADHLFGTFVLRQVGRLIAKNIREVDLAARYGGDEFLVVLCEVDQAGAQVFSERLRKVIGEHEYNDGKHRANRTISIGYALSDPLEAVSAQDLVRRADNALYEAKHGGRNCVKQYSPKS